MTSARSGIHLICLLVGVVAFGQAPQTNHVVEKVVTKNIASSPKDLLKIVGEKATIHVTGWEKDYIRVKLTFSAKNPDKASAERELDYMKYALGREDNTLEIRNTFILPAEVSGTRSSLAVTYEINVPRESKVSITDKYGNINLTGLKGELDVSVEFGDLHLQNVDAKIRVEITYGEMRGKGIGGTFACKSGKSDIYLESIKAPCSFNSTYGTIRLTLGDKPPGITVKAARTAVVVNTPDFGGYRYELRTSHAAIHVPEQHKKYVQQTEGSATSALHFAKAQHLPLIKINTTFSPITIHTNP